MSEERLQYLFQRHLEKILSPQEKEELFGAALEPGMDESLKKLILQAWSTTGEEHDLPETKAEAMMKEIFPNEGAIKYLWRKFAVAASILLAIGLGMYFVFFNHTTRPNRTVQADLSHDVLAPKLSKATITLSDGKVVYIDSAANGTLATQGNVKVTKLADGRIIYDGHANGTDLNTLTNPKGSKVLEVTFTDGTHVWLNAGSSVTYPVAFTGNNRSVSITGEAYFEVTHNPNKPFIVSKGETSIQVLGTHFNVNAYDDESDIKVTLLEGAVKVTKGFSSVSLEPGQQAQVAGEVKVLNSVDTDQAIAWKNGLFKFDKTDIQNMMRQAERWYDIRVSYPNGVPTDRFGGTLSRDVSLSQFLKILEYSDVNAKVEGKIVTIKP